MGPAALEGGVPFAATAVESGELSDGLVSDGAELDLDPMPTAQWAGARSVDLVGVAPPLASLGLVMGREWAFDEVLAAKDLDLLETSFTQFFRLRQARETELALAVTQHLELEFGKLGLDPPARIPVVSELGFNLSSQASYSQFLRQKCGSLADLIALVRGEHVLDSRPNKALVVPDCEFPHKDLWVDIVKHGVVPRWLDPFPKQTAPHKNHQSWSEGYDNLITQVAAGQQKGEYLILDGDLLPMLLEQDWVFVSPFGGASKDGQPISVCARITHDTSFPRDGFNVNSNTDKLDVEIHYDGPKEIARWALFMEQRFPGTATMMKGDVAGAFRNLHIHRDHCGRFAAYIAELNVVVVNLTLPFGWTDSPAHYWIAGGAIAAIHNSRHGFYNLVYCDDHMLMQAKVGFRARAEELALRRAMILVLGTRACNEKKFTTWARVCTALGLTFDFDTQTVSMPPAKIAKAIGQLLSLLALAKVHSKVLREVLGLMRHVACCVPAARPFYNRLQARLCVLDRVSLPLALGVGATEDVRWLLLLLRSGGMNGVSWQRFSASKPPNCHINMDASDWGVCGVWQEKKQYFAIPWSEEESELIAKFKSREDMTFSINIRELLGAYFAMSIWIDTWKQLYGQEAHVRFVIDNMSAVAWSNTRSSGHPQAQTVLRVMGLLEATYHLYSTAEHISGADNGWADAGSRKWASVDACKNFELLSTDYVQVEVAPRWRRPSDAWAECCKTEPSHLEAMKFMEDIGVSGVLSAKPWGTQ